HRAAGVHHRDPADPVVPQQARDHRDRRFPGDSDHPGRHDLLDLHGRTSLRSGGGRPTAVNASRIIWQVNPHSLSYQLMTLTRIPSTTLVIAASTNAARGSPMLSAETTGSSATPRILR